MGALFLVLLCVLCMSVFGDADLEDILLQLKSRSPSLLVDLVHLWQGEENITYSSNEFGEQVVVGLHGLSSVWQREKKSARLPSDMDMTIENEEDEPPLLELPNLRRPILRDPGTPEKTIKQIPPPDPEPESPDFEFPSGLSETMLMLQNFTNSLSRSISPSPVSAIQRGSNQNMDMIGQVQSLSSDLQASASDPAMLLKANRQMIQEPGTAPVLPMPANTAGTVLFQELQKQPQYLGSQEAANQSPTPTNFPFPIPANATLIPPASPPQFSPYSPLPLDSLPNPFRSIPTTPEPTPTIAQQTRQVNPPSLQTPTRQQPQLQEQQEIGLSSVILQPSLRAPAQSAPTRTSAGPSYATSSCSGKRDKPGRGTRCGCFNIVPEGFCACAQVFYLQQCNNPDVFKTSDENPNGFCDVTCGRCSCCPSVYDQAVNLNLTTFVEMLDTISLVSGGGMGGGKSITDSLKNPSHTATVFVPTDEAFRELYEEELGQTKVEFLAKAPPLFKIAQTHILLSLYAASAEELLSGELGFTLATQLPTSYVTLIDQDATVPGMILEAPGSSARIVQPDVNGCHSVIHIIDQVLLSYVPEQKYG